MHKNSVWLLGLPLTLSLTACSSEFFNGGQDKLSLSVDNQGGGIIVVTTRDGEVNCLSGTVCELDLLQGENVQLEATPNTGFAFDAWEGVGCESSPCQFEIDGDMVVVARFRQT